MFGEVLSFHAVGGPAAKRGNRLFRRTKMFSKFVTLGAAAIVAGGIMTGASTTSAKADVKIYIGGVVRGCRDRVGDRRG